MVGPPAAPPRVPSGRWVRPSPALGGIEAVVGVDPLVADLPSDLEAYRPLLRRLRQGGPVAPGESALAEDAASVWARPGFDTFVSLSRLRARPLPYQLQTAASVVRRLHGRAILADEPGLGKGFEAGLVLSELRLRGMARRALVLAPGSLVTHWEEELERTFALPCTLATPAGQDGSGSPAPASGQDAGGPGAPVVVTSFAAAVRSPLREALLAEPWDVVVVDEAHRAKSARSAPGRLVRALTARRLLLLTATPVEESPDDLLQLASLVRPGRLDVHAVRARTGPGGSNSEARARLRDVMVRHRRSEVAVHLPRRITDTRAVVPTGDEAALYAAVAERARTHGRGAPSDRAIALRHLLRRAGSSPHAAAPALAALGWGDLAERAAAIGVTAAQRALVDLVRAKVEQGERVLVVTAFRPTLEAIARHMAAADITPAVYHAGLARAEKDEVVAAFGAESGARGPGAGVLLSTEAAGEGRDLTSCHLLVNADLPWDPLQLDRRIARLERIGQGADVCVTTLVTLGTVEERVLRVLEGRLGLFDLVAGEVDSVVARLGEDADVEAEVFAAHLASADDAEVAARIDAIGDALARARAGYLVGRARTDELIGGVVP